MSSRTQQLAFRAVLLGVSIAMTVVTVEIGLRAIGRDTPRVWAPEPQVGWLPIPGARIHWTDEGDGQVLINSQGFRDRERHVDRDPLIPRIAVFGDSQTEADQVNLDQTYSSQLEARLGQRGPAEVLNFGVTGYSPIQELLLFRREVDRYRPDVVVLGLFLDNDVSGCDPQLSVAPEAPFAEVEGKDLRFDYSRAVRSYEDYHREPMYFLRKYSAVYRLISAIRTRRAKMSAAEAPTTRGVPVRFEVYEKEPGPKWQHAWTVLDGVLSAFQRDAQQRGIQLIVLSIPAAQVVVRASWEALMAENVAMRDKSWDLEGPERRLAQMAATRQIRLVQPYKTFEATHGGDPLFFGNVGHMTRRGHSMIAAAVKDYLDHEIQFATPLNAHARP